VNLYLQIPLVQVILSLALIPIVLKANYRKAPNILFSIYLFGLAMWGALIYMMRSSPTLEIAYSWEQWLMGIAAFPAIIFFHFSVRYTRFDVPKWLIPLTYVVATFFLMISQTDWVITGMQLRSYGYAPIVKPLFLILVTFCYVFLAISFVSFFRAGKRTHYIEERNRYYYIMTGITFSLVGALFDILPIFGLPLYPGIIIGNILFCIITTYAIAKHHLLDINLVLRKGTSYLLVSTMIAIPYVGLLFLLHAAFNGRIPFWINYVTIILLALVLLPLWSRLQNIIDRLFYRQRYNYLKALRDFSLETHNINDFEQLSSSLVTLVGRALQSNRVSLLLRDKQEDFVTSSSSVEDDNKLTIKKHSPLSKFLSEKKDAITIHDLNFIPRLQGLTENERVALAKMEIQLIIPLKIRTGELIGLLLLSRKLSDQLYSTEDIEIISAIADRVAIELENAHLYFKERKLRRQLELEIKQKDEFLHSLAHELKTPLTAIISSSEILDAEVTLPSSKQKKRLIRNITYSANIMNKRINELLDLGRIQIGSIVLNKEPVKIELLLDSCVSQLLPLFQNKVQMVKLEVSQYLPRVIADREKLEQVIINLLANANKYTPMNGAITIKAEEVNDTIIVSVKDTAPIIPEKFQNKLFDPYFRGSNPDTGPNLGGLGLGLALSKKLVELHNGKIWLECSSETGNTFAFSLPVLSGKIKGELVGITSSSESRTDT